MSEDVEASLFILLILENIFKTNRYRGNECFIDLNVTLNKCNLTVLFFLSFRSMMGKLETNALYSILDEIVFKISASEESSVGR